MIYWIYTQVDPSYLVVYICLHMFTLLLASGIMSVKPCRNPRELQSLWQKNPDLPVAGVIPKETSFMHHDLEK
jgi:hypothetical protein